MTFGIVKEVNDNPSDYRVNNQTRNEWKKMKCRKIHLYELNEFMSFISLMIFVSHFINLYQALLKTIDT